MTGMIIFLTLMTVGAIIATDSFVWGIGVVLFMILSVVLPIEYSTAIAVLVVISLFLFQDRLE